MASAPDVLVSFVREALSRGVPRGEIGRELERAGWSSREAALALDAFAESTIPVPVPRKRVSSSPRDAFLHLLATALLYNSVVATGTEPARKVVIRASGQSGALQAPRGPRRHALPGRSGKDTKGGPPREAKAVPASPHPSACRS